jgi:hypothetical protein
MAYCPKTTVQRDASRRRPEMRAWLYLLLACQGRSVVYYCKVYTYGSVHVRAVRRKRIQSAASACDACWWHLLCSACMHALMHVRTRTLARCCTDGLQSSYCPSVVDHQSMQQQGKHHRCIILALHRRHTGPTYRRRKAACTLHSQVSRRQQQGRGSDRARTSACHIRKRAEDADRVRQARPSGSFHSK